MQIRRLGAMMRKEAIHILRDFRSLIIVFALPVFMLLMFGYAINTEIRNVDLAVLDHSGTPASRELVRQFTGSGYFSIASETTDPGGIEQLFQQRKAQVALLIQHDFARAAAGPGRRPIQVIIDGSDPNAAQLTGGYVEQIVSRVNSRSASIPPVDVSVKIAYNPGLRSVFFFVPGLVALILTMISALLTSIAIVREKESGSLEQILVSPVSPGEIILGKVFPYLILAALDGLMILIIANGWFGVPVRGSLLLLAAGALLFVFVSLALGLLISTAARSQQVAMLAALFATMLPTLILSGFIFPVASMPLPLQIISRIVPASWFLKIIRGVMLKGNGFAEIALPIGVLAFMACGLIFASIRKFRTTL